MYAIRSYYESREIVDTVEEHEPIEIPCEKGKITIGPPTLTRFEKARIMGARALQLSLGAPPFIPIPKTARISLRITSYNVCYTKLLRQTK